MRPSASWIGREVDGRYRIVRPLGGGGMGSVYEAEHLRLGKRVALKVIRPELVADDEIRERFEREARATASIDHPHVITAMDFGPLPDGGAYLVTQLVRGISLRERMSAGAIRWREACELGAQIADALSAIHGLGFVHRDLTPDNVLLTKRDDGTTSAHLLDLGVVGLTDEAAHRPRLTAEGHIVGTPGYMAPEQALGEAVDARADLYALGVLLWEMCSGRTLFEEQALTQVVARQLTEPIPPIEPPRGAVPPQLASLVNALATRHREERPAHASAVRDELRALGGV
ncbi:MAG TPA: serine/threonine-protein kinase, partial [Sandaracinaceae bacterium LLY-WYZ-13_1]|nr:serine/threonine-protein kinase [Sandaracinaceae bacterium LLY-WYZ-13_1]